MAGKTVQTLDQQRAAFAWNCVVEVRGAGLDFNAYTNLAKSAPALIMGNGLMATLAFFQQKKRSGPEAKKLTEQVCKWIKRQVGEVGDDGFAGVMEVLHEMGSGSYLQVTEEALEILRWIRQFAPALKE